MTVTADVFVREPRCSDYRPPTEIWQIQRAYKRSQSNQQNWWVRCICGAVNAAPW